VSGVEKSGKASLRGGRGGRDVWRDRKKKGEEITVGIAWHAARNPFREREDRNKTREGGNHISSKRGGLARAQFQAGGESIDNID